MGTYRFTKRVLYTKKSNYEKLKRSTFHFEVVIFHLCVVKLQFIILVLYVEPMKYFSEKVSLSSVI